MMSITRIWFEVDKVVKEWSKAITHLLEPTGRSVLAEAVQDELTRTPQWSNGISILINITCRYRGFSLCTTAIEIPFNTAMEKYEKGTLKVWLSAVMSRYYCRLWKAWQKAMGDIGPEP